MRRSAPGAVAAAVALGCATYRPPPPEPPPPPFTRQRVVVAPASQDANQAAAEVAAALAERGELEPELRMNLVADGRAELERRRQRTAALLAEAERLLHRLDLAGGRRVLDQAAAAMKPGLEFQSWVRMEVARAMADLAEGKAAAAERRLAEVARLAPQQDLDPRLVPPEAVDAFRRARAAVAAAPRGRIRVECRPEPVSLLVDGRPAACPLDVEIGAGRHFLGAEGVPGLGALGVEAQVRPGEITLTRIALDPLAGPRLAMAYARPGSAMLAGPGGSRQVQALNARELAAVVTASWGPTPARPVWKGVPPNTGRDRPWYRTWWGWALVGSAGLIALRLR